MGTRMHAFKTFLKWWTTLVTLLYSRGVQLKQTSCCVLVHAWLSQHAPLTKSVLFSVLYSSKLSLCDRLLLRLVPLVLQSAEVDSGGLFPIACIKSLLRELSLKKDIVKHVLDWTRSTARKLIPNVSDDTVPVPYIIMSFLQMSGSHVKCTKA